PPAGMTQPEMMDYLRFFLTAQSRAPDLNLFGQPRISLWPITQEDGSGPRQTVYDRLIAFCSTAGLPANGKTFYFERSDPLSQHADWAIPRNQTLLASYLLGLTSKAFPGFSGGSLQNKYNSTFGGVSG